MIDPGPGDPGRPLPGLVRLTERVPGWVALACASLLFSALLLWESRRPGLLPAVPVYFLIPIALIAWFNGWRMAITATVFSAAASTLILLWQGNWSSYTPIFYVGRLATFLLVAGAARGLSTGLLMLDFYYRGRVWRSVQRPRRVSERFIIVPAVGSTPDGEYSGRQPNDILIFIRPGLAFGTASHPTTQMCLTLLESSVRPGMAVLDVGCGTGILTIAAAKLGAAQVLAVDIDPEAGRVARMNIALNQVGDIAEFRTGSLEAASRIGDPNGHGSGHLPGSHSSAGVYDLVVANIFASVIVELLEAGLLDLLKPGGALVLSGARESEIPRLRGDLEARSLVVEKALIELEWAALLARPTD